MWIRPPTIIRLVGAFSAAVVVGLAIAAVVAATDGALRGAMLAAAATGGALLIVRAFRAGVYLDRDRLTIHGLVRSRTIQRHAIIKIRIDEFPSIVWRGDDDKQRSTLLLGFVSGDGNHAKFASTVAPALTEVQRWAETR